jgi:anti-anti-sigma factor
MSGFDLTVARLAPRTHVASVSGEVGLDDDANLRRRLLPLASVADATLIVDLCGAPHLETSTLGTLRVLAQLLRSRGGDLVVATDVPRVRRLFETAGLSNLLSVESSLAGAVERVGSAPAA